jgi:hypothetical protein
MTLSTVNVASEATAPRIGQCSAGGISPIALDPAVVGPVDVLGDRVLEGVDVLPWALFADKFGP